MDRREYREEYLKSEHWLSLRQEALAHADHRCQVCYVRKHLDVHHRTYHRLGREELGDLTVLCRRCHSVFHHAGSLARRPGNAVEPPPELRKRRRKHELRAAHENEVVASLLGRELETREVAERTRLTIDQAGGALSRLQRQRKVERIEQKGAWRLLDNG